MSTNPYRVPDLTANETWILNLRMEAMNRLSTMNATLEAMHGSRRPFSWDDVVPESIVAPCYGRNSLNNINPRYKRDSAAMPCPYCGGHAIDKAQCCVGCGAAR